MLIEMTYGNKNSEHLWSVSYESGAIPYFNVLILKIFPLCRYYNTLTLQMRKLKQGKFG